MRNLARKQGGEDVDFINIADARNLTELGLATRTQQGWVISEAGLRLLSAEETQQTPEAPTSITPFKPKLV